MSAESLTPHHIPTPARAARRELCDGLNCFPGPRWAVSAGMLNALWSDLFPRVAVAYWLKRSGPALVPPPWMIGGNERDLSDILAHAPGNAIHLAANEIAGTATFNARRLNVIAHFGSGGSIPVRVMGEGEFDFILSDQGLDLFVPGEPMDLRDMIRYYTFRGTGKRSVGIPNYIGQFGPGAPVPAVSKSTALTADSPTGPSQIDMSYQAVQARIISVFVGNIAMKDCVEAVLHCLETKSSQGAHAQQDGNASVTRAYYDQAQSIASKLLQRETVTPQDLDTFKAAEIRLRERPSPGGVDHTFVPHPTRMVSMSAEEYACLMEPLRCWQLSGAVYRAILTELPRVVATVWLEQIDGVAGGSSYTANFAQGGDGNPDVGIRKIFRERLETSLPLANSMYFRTYTPAQAAALGWLDNDVMVTNEGLHLPQIQALNLGNPATTKATWDGIYDEIMKGRAGNPVFTDSIYCL